MFLQVSSTIWERWRVVLKKQHILPQGSNGELLLFGFRNVSHGITRVLLFAFAFALSQCH